MSKQTVTFNPDTTEFLELKSDYTKVTDDKAKHYGGNQTWFRGMPYYGIISPNGCGLIAICDICLYLSGQKSANRSPLTDGYVDGQIEAGEYVEYVKSFNDLYVNLRNRMDPIGRKYGMNNLDGKTGKILAVYFKSNMIPLKVSSHPIKDPKSLGGNSPTTLKSYSEIRGSIANDLPVIMGISPSDKEKAVMLYTRKKSAPLTFTPSRTTQNHYVTVTGVVTDSSAKAEDSVMYQISSWGREYFISASDLNEHLSSGEGFIGNMIAKKSNSLTIINPR